SSDKNSASSPIPHARTALGFVPGTAENPQGYTVSRSGREFMPRNRSKTGRISPDQIKLPKILSPLFALLARPRTAFGDEDISCVTEVAYSKLRCESSAGAMIIFFFGLVCGAGRETDVSSLSSFATIVFARSITLRGRPPR